MPVAKPGSICWTTALALAAALAVAAAAVPRLTQMVGAPSIGLEVAKGEGRIPGRLRHATGRGSAKSSSSELERKLCSIDEVAERDGDCAMEAEAGDDGPDELVMEAELDRADDTDEGSEEHEAERLVPADVVVRFRRRRRRELALAEKIEPLTPSRCVSISNSGPSSETESETRFLRHMGPIGCQLGSICEKDRVYASQRGSITHRTAPGLGPSGKNPAAPWMLLTHLPLSITRALAVGSRCGLRLTSGVDAPPLSGTAKASRPCTAAAPQALSLTRTRRGHRRAARRQRQ